MHAFVSFNQKIHSPDEIKISAISAAAFYGRGIFTSLAVYNQKPFQWKKHWQRLVDNAAKVNLNISNFSEETVKNALSEIINRNKAENARARITFFDETASRLWSFETNRKTGVLITTADFREAEKDLRLTVSPFLVNSKSTLANIKSCNYLENILALENAKAQGFDEALRLNERGEIASACMANVFWIKNEKIFTPAIETGCLEGTTRSFIIEELAKEIGFEALSAFKKTEEIFDADEVFLTSTGVGIASVGKIDEKAFDNEITAKLQRIFAEKIQTF